MLALIGAAAAPFLPESLGLPQRGLGIDRLGQVEMRGTIGEHEGNGLAGAHLEIGNRRHVLAAGLDRRTQHRHVLARDREQRRAVLGPLHPGNIDAEAEADHELHPHLHLAFDTAHQAYDIGSLAARRHEIDQRDNAIGGFELRLQDQRLAR